MIAFIALIIAGIELGMLVAGYVAHVEQGDALRHFMKDNAILRQEIQAMTDSIARASRMPIYRQQEKQPLEKSETWYERIPEVIVKSS
jgi:hypothetical protein